MVSLYRQISVYNVCRMSYAILTDTHQLGDTQMTAARSQKVKKDKRYEVRDSRGGFIGHWIAKNEREAVVFAKDAANRGAAVFRGQRVCTDFYVAREVAVKENDEACK